MSPNESRVVGQAFLPVSFFQLYLGAVGGARAGTMPRQTLHCGQAQVVYRNATGVVDRNSKSLFCARASGARPLEPPTATRRRTPRALRLHTRLAGAAVPAGAPRAKG